MNHSPDEYLKASDYIDWREPAVHAKALELAGGSNEPINRAERCFLFVRDEIKHSGDHLIDTVTCRASEVLKHKTGWCYAKSHLLAALLRANGVPAGLCYQRLPVGDAGPPYCLHGLNAAKLPGVGWYRMDPRGNKEGVDAQFTPPIEKLAFALSNDAECDLPEVFAAPHPAVIRCLISNSSCEAVHNHLPDIDS